MSGFYWLQATFSSNLVNLKLVNNDLFHCYVEKQALTALLGGGFALAVLPETRDKTFTQLENIFSPNYEEKELV